jgi:hypothetical protein
LANHTYNEGQIGWFVAGSALNLIAAEKHNFNFKKRSVKTERFFVSRNVKNYNELLKLFKTQIIRLNSCNTFNASLVVIS